MKLLHRAEPSDAYLSAAEHELLCRLAFAGVVGEPLSVDDLARARAIIASRDDGAAPDPFERAPPLQVAILPAPFAHGSGRGRHRPSGPALARYVLVAAAGITIAAACAWLFAGMALSVLEAL